MRRRVLIMGAAGRDFHNFLVFFKGNRRYDVAGFTAEQIPGIGDRTFPAKLAGSRYPRGIPIYPESQLPDLVGRLRIDDVCLAYSDLSHQEVMQKASLSLAAGATFLMLGTQDTWVMASKPVIAVTAVRTGCGKSQTARAIGELLRKHGKKVIAIRHSMPYGNLTEQACQRFAEEGDFERFRTTVEEEEEYQPWIDHGFVVYSGFDYKTIVRKAEREGDILIFDGGNNDMPLIRPDLHITVTDPHRAGHELSYYPGFVNFLAADIVIINKVDSAPDQAVKTIIRNAKDLNGDATVIRARSEITVDHPERIKNRRCAVIGDGPTLTHGGSTFGAGTLAVKRHGGRLADPRRALVGSLKEIYRKYPHLSLEIPAMGYGRQQIKDLESTVSRVQCDVVVDGSPANLKRIMKIKKPVVNVGYELGSRAVRALERELKKRNLIK
jgi:predicted GTPase